MIQVIHYLNDQPYHINLESVLYQVYEFPVIGYFVDLHHHTLEDELDEVEVGLGQLLYQQDSLKNLDWVMIGLSSYLFLEVVNELSLIGIEYSLGYKLSVLLRGRQM